jgi:hypothetical protein
MHTHTQTHTHTHYLSGNIVGATSREQHSGSNIVPAALLMISTVVFAHLVYFQLHLPGAGGGGLGVGFRVLLVLKGPQGTGLSLSLPLPLPLSLLQCGCGCLRLFFWHGRRVQQMHVLRRSARTISVTNPCCRGHSQARAQTLMHSCVWTCANSDGHFERTLTPYAHILARTGGVHVSSSSTRH